MWVFLTQGGLQVSRPLDPKVRETHTRWWASELFSDQWMWLLCVSCRWCCSRSRSSRVGSGSCWITLPVWRTALRLCGSRVGCACLCHRNQPSWHTFTDMFMLLSDAGHTPEASRQGRLRRLFKTVNLITKKAKAHSIIDEIRCLKKQSQRAICVIIYLYIMHQRHPRSKNLIDVQK